MLDRSHFRTLWRKGITSSFKLLITVFVYARCAFWHCRGLLLVGIYYCVLFSARLSRAFPKICWILLNQPYLFWLLQTIENLSQLTTQGLHYLSNIINNRRTFVNWKPTIVHFHCSGETSFINTKNRLFVVDHSE